MKRSGFKSKAPSRTTAVDREVRLSESAARLWASAFSSQMAKPSMVPKIASLIGPEGSGKPLVSVPKEVVERSEPYRRLVAALPCSHCRIEGLSQHAHENLGKGAGLKVDDRRGFPLCCVSPGREGCHEKFDQGRLLPGGREAHRAAGTQWAAETRTTIIDLGLWPKKLPLWKEDQ